MKGEGMKEGDEIERRRRMLGAQASTQRGEARRD